MASTIEVGLTLSLDEYEKRLKDAENKGRKAGGGAGDGFSDGFVGGAKKGLTALGPAIAAAVAAAAAAAAAFQFGKKAVEASIIQQDAVNALNTSLRLAGRFSEEASSQFQEFASALQETTTVGDETTLKLGSLASNFARSNEEAQKMTEAAIELSAAMGIDAESALKNLGKSFSGLTGELGEALPIVKELTVEQLKSGAAVDLILQRFGGAAASKVNTFSGAMAQLTNIFGDVQENIGALVTESPVMIALFKEISKAFIKAGSAIKEFAASGDIIGEIIISVVKFGEAVNRFMIAPIEIAVNAMKVALNAILTVITQSLSELSSVAAKIVGFFSEDSQLAQALRAFSESGADAAVDFSSKTQMALGNIFNVDNSESAAKFLASLKQTLSEARDAVENSGLDIAAKKTGQKAESVVVEIGKTVGQGLTSIIAGAAQRIGASLVKGGDAFADFGKFVLNIIGDMAIKIGTTLIGIGLGIDALSLSLTVLSGGAAIAAGLALVALGGALKALGGGGVSSPAAGGGGIGGGATQPSPEEVVGPSPEDTELKAPATEVVINVQGNVLDRKETGMELVEAIREHFDSEGGVIAV